MFIASIFDRGNRSLSGRHCRDSSWWDVYGQYVTKGIITIETCCTFTLFSNRSWCYNQANPCLLHNSLRVRVSFGILFGEDHNFVNVLT